MRDGPHILRPPYTLEKDLETSVYNAIHHIMSHDEVVQRKVLSFLRRSKNIPDTCESMKRVLGACPDDTAIVAMLRQHYPFDDSSKSIFINVLKNTFEDVNQIDARFVSVLRNVLSESKHTDIQTFVNMLCETCDFQLY
jgi:hypothetical protein